MGPSIVLAATLWGAVSHRLRARVAAFARRDRGRCVWAPPVGPAMGSLAALPDLLEGYIRPIPGLTNFTFFPWTAFVTAGAVVGVILDAARTPATGSARQCLHCRPRRPAVGVGRLRGARSCPRWCAPRSSGRPRQLLFHPPRVLMAAVGARLLWDSDAWQRAPLESPAGAGPASLFVYWIHVELVYGLISLPFTVLLRLRCLVGLVVFAIADLAVDCCGPPPESWWRRRHRIPV